MEHPYLIRVELSNPASKLPMPGTKRLFTGVETVDSRDVFWIACLRDGSIRLAQPPGPDPDLAPAPEE